MRDARHADPLRHLGSASETGRLPPQISSSRGEHEIQPTTKPIASAASSHGQSDTMR